MTVSLPSSTERFCARMWVKFSSSGLPSGRFENVKLALTDSRYNLAPIMERPSALVNWNCSASELRHTRLRWIFFLLVSLWRFRPLHCRSSLLAGWIGGVLHLIVLGLNNDSGGSVVR